MDLQQVSAVLARTPSVLDTLLTGLPAEWLHHNDGPGTWSAYDIVGHLLHADATNFLPRARMILQHGAGRPFEPFQRDAMLGWEREPASALIARFQVARHGTLDELSSMALAPSDLKRRGLHPEIGEVALGQVLATWVTHDLTHLGQVGEVLARYYRDDVGPFRAFMPALERTAQAE